MQELQMHELGSEHAMFYPQHKFQASLLHKRLADSKSAHKQLRHVLKRQQSGSRLGQTVKLMLAMAARRDPVLAHQLKRQLLREVQTVVEVSRAPQDPSCAGLLRQLSSGLLVEVLEVYNKGHSTNTSHHHRSTSSSGLSSSSADDISSCTEDASSSGYDSDGGSSCCSQDSMDGESITKMLEDALVTAAVKAQAGSSGQEGVTAPDVEAVMQMELHQCLQLQA